jgi:hypothetical protein
MTTGAAARRSPSCGASGRADTEAQGKQRDRGLPETHLVPRAQVAVDPAARVIIAVPAEPAAGSGADALDRLIGRARFAGDTPAGVGADAGYASLASYARL